ncbi:hypothetical protein IWX47DRAFT_526641 [Phyllosticta citricarpa]
MTRSSRRMFMELQAIQRMARPVKLRRIARNRRGFAAGLCAEEAKLRSALYQHHTVYRIRAVEMVRTFLRLLLVLLIAPLNASPAVLTLALASCVLPQHSIKVMRRGVGEAVSSIHCRAVRLRARQCHLVGVFGCLGSVDMLSTTCSLLSLSGCFSYITSAARTREDFRESRCIVERCLRDKKNRGPIRMEHPEEGHRHQPLSCIVSPVFKCQILNSIDSKFL